MNIIITRAVQDKIAWFFGIILYLIVGTLGYTYLLSLDNPIKVLDSPKTIQSVIAGDKFEICRTVEYTRRAKVDVGRSMTHKNKNIRPTNTVSYPTFSLIRDKGIYYICRDMYIPIKTKPGIWTVHTFLTIHTAPFWEKYVETKKFQIEVLKGCK